MSSQPSAPSAPPPSGGDGPSRLHIRAIEEMPPSHDHELAVIFREMRRATGVSKDQLAGRLATTTDAIEALEAGALQAMPEWPELKRVVTTYAAQLGLDARPILRRLASQIGVDEPVGAPARPEAASAAPPPRAAAAMPTAGPPMPPSAKKQKEAASASTPAANPLPRPPAATLSSNEATVTQPQQAFPAQADGAAEKKSSGRTGRILKGLLNWLLLIGFVAALGFGVWYAAQNPRQVWTAMDGLPDPIPRLLRSAWELVRPLEGNGSDAQVFDPDKRKSDKLP